MPAPDDNFPGFAELLPAFQAQLARETAAGCYHVRHLEFLPNVYDYYCRARTIARDLGPGARILDWGAGWGQMSWFLRALGLKPLPYNIDDPAPDPWNRLLREEFPAAVWHDDPVRLPFPDASFAAALSCGVLEHVAEFGGDPAASLAELNRVLAPGGRLFVALLPNAFSWVENLNLALGRLAHTVWYLPGRARALFAAAGFADRDRRPVNLLPKTLDFLPRPLRRGLSATGRAYAGLDRLLCRLPPLNLFAGAWEFTLVKVRCA